MRSGLWRKRYFWNERLHGSEPKRTAGAEEPANKAALCGEKRRSLRLAILTAESVKIKKGERRCHISIVAKMISEQGNVIQRTRLVFFEFHCRGFDRPENTDPRQIGNVPQQVIFTRGIVFLVFFYLSHGLVGLIISSICGIRSKILRAKRRKEKENRKQGARKLPYKYFFSSTSN